MLGRHSKVRKKNKQNWVTGGLQAFYAGWLGVMVPRRCWVSMAKFRERKIKNNSNL